LHLLIIWLSSEVEYKFNLLNGDYMLSKKITLSLLSLVIATPFAHATKPGVKPEPVEIIKRADGSTMILGGLPMHQPTRWENFVYKVAPMSKYILPASASVGTATAAIALGLSLRDKASLKHAAITAATAGAASFGLSLNCLFWTHFGITESLD
jgi:hypothetical protein